MSRGERIRRIRQIKLLERAASEFTPPAFFFGKEEFQQKSYAYWAAQELVKRVKESDVDPERTVVAFIQRMDWYSMEKLDTSFMFSVAYDTAMYMYDRVFCTPTETGIVRVQNVDISPQDLQALL